MIGSTGSTLESCLEKCRSSLEAWNKIVFGHVGRKVAELQKRLEWLELQPSSMEINKDMKRTGSDLNIWLEKEDDMWRQQSRINWLQSGNRNTSFFRAKASARQKKNFIEGILDENEVWQEDEEKVADMMVKYYEELFTTCQPSNFTDLLQAVQTKVTTSMNQWLTRDFTKSEVRFALKQMYPLKHQARMVCLLSFSRNFGT